MQIALLPRFLQVELTYECNSACIFCYNPNHKKQPDDEIRKKVLSQVNRYQIDHVQLIGGEVSLLPHLTDYLDILKDVRWRSLVTNGRIYVPNLAGRVHEIYLSLHGNAAMHEDITNAPGSFETILETARKYVADGILVHSDSILTSENYSNIFEMAARAKDVGCSTMFLNIFQAAGIGTKREDRLAPNVRQIRVAIGQMIEAKEKLGIRVQFGTSTPFCLDERLITHDLKFKCGVGDWFASIDPQGEFRLCNQSTKSYGNILEQPISRIWHDKRVDAEYRSLNWLAEPCASCEAKIECQGGCRVGDKGEYRIDPLLRREPNEFVSPQRIAEILAEQRSLSYESLIPN